MSRLIPQDIGVHGNTTHNVNINILGADTANAIGKSLESLIITWTVASVMRSWFRKK